MYCESSTSGPTSAPCTFQQATIHVSQVLLGLPRPLAPSNKPQYMWVKYFWASLGLLHLPTSHNTCESSTSGPTSASCTFQQATIHVSQVLLGLPRPLAPSNKPQYTWFKYFWAYLDLLHLPTSHNTCESSTSGPTSASCTFRQATIHVSQVLLGLPRPLAPSNKPQYMWVKYFWAYLGLLHLPTSHNTCESSTSGPTSTYCTFRQATIHVSQVLLGLPRPLAPSDKPQYMWVKYFWAYLGLLHLPTSHNTCESSTSGPTSASCTFQQATIHVSQVLLGIPRPLAPSNKPQYMWVKYFWAYLGLLHLPTSHNTRESTTSGPTSASCTFQQATIHVSQVLLGLPRPLAPSNEPQYMWVKYFWAYLGLLHLPTSHTTCEASTSGPTSASCTFQQATIHVRQVLLGLPRPLAPSDKPQYCLFAC